MGGIKKHAASVDIGNIIDNALDAIEKENDSLKGVLTKNYSRQELDKTRLGELVTLFTNIEVGSTAAQDFILTLGRYVGIEEQEDDGEPFEKKCRN